MKTTENMTDHELLMALVRARRRQSFWTGVRIVVSLLLIAAILTLGYLYLPKVLAPYQEYRQTMNQLQESLDRFNTAMDQFDAMSAEAKQQIDSVSSDAKEQLDSMSEQAQALFDQIEDLHLDKLQESAVQLEEMVDRLSDFFRLGSGN